MHECWLCSKGKMYLNKYQLCPDKYCSVNSYSVKLTYHKNVGTYGTDANIAIFTTSHIYPCVYYSLDNIMKTLQSIIANNKINVITTKVLQAITIIVKLIKHYEVTC